MTDLTCEEFRDLSAEFALGVLEGRERAEAIAHVEHCAACQHESATMGDVADMLFELTPSAEPPAGLETRVLGLVRPDHARARRIVRLAIAAAVAALIGVGGWAIGHSGARQRSAVPPSGAVTAPFVTNDHHVGEVVAWGGRLPWVAMAVDTTLGDGTVSCQLTQRNGPPVTLGTFTLSAGYGYWSAALTVPLDQVSGARLVDSDGQTVAIATFAKAPAARA